MPASGCSRWSAPPPSPRFTASRHGRPKPRKPGGWRQRPIAARSSACAVVGRKVREEKGKRFFFEKKKQKTFINLGRAGFTALGPAQKKFLRRFFQKAPAFFLSEKLSHAHQYRAFQRAAAVGDVVFAFQRDVDGRRDEAAGDQAELRFVGAVAAVHLQAIAQHEILLAAKALEEAGRDHGV